MPKLEKNKATNPVRTRAESEEVDQKQQTKVPRGKAPAEKKTPVIDRNAAKKAAPNGRRNER